LPAKDEFAAFMRQRGLHAKTNVVVYDQAQSLFAARLWWMLRWLGHQHVAILDGGWQAWLAHEAGAHTKKQDMAAPDPGLITNPASPQMASMPVVEMPALLDNLRKPRYTVV